jgi:hypothetical protein
LLDLDGALDVVALGVDPEFGGAGVDEDGDLLGRSSNGDWERLAQTLSSSEQASVEKDILVVA